MWQNKPRLTHLVLALVLLFAGAVGSLLSAIVRTRSIDETQQADAILVLGAGVLADGSASDVLAARVSHAAVLYEMGLAPLIALTGGPRSDRTPEALVARDLLLARGIPPEAILLEADSLTTSQNAAFIAPLLAEHNVESVLLVTSPYHQWRASQMVRDAGFRVYHAPSQPAPSEERLPQSAWHITREGGAWLLYRVFGW